nr:hypothetical protein [uncultured Duganella sp.]
MLVIPRTIVSIVSAALVACGGGGSSSPAVSNPPAPTGPITPVDPKPPVVTPPTISTCAAPTTTPAQVLFNGTPMLALCDGVYVEPTATADQQLSLRQSVALAYTAVTDFYGTFTAPRPQMIFCQTQSCRAYFMGSYGGVYSPLGFQLPGATYQAGKPTLFVTYTSFPNLGRETIAHELTHTETLYRYGAGGVPAWFNEGLATMIGKSPDCTNQTVNWITDLRTVDGAAALAQATADSSKGDAIYCQAQREVAAWVGINGKPKFIDLLTGVKSGQQFYTLYGNLINR